MTDTLAEDLKTTGQLCVAAQQARVVSREFLDHRGKIEQPQAKSTRYQKAYLEHGLGNGVELQASERSKSSHTREERGR